MTYIPTSLSILKTELSGNLIGIAIQKLPKRSIFQSIGDYFSSKSGNERISFLLVSDQHILSIHTRGNEILEKLEIPKTHISKIQTWNKSSHEPQQLDIQIVTETPGKKEGQTIHKTFDFELFPAFLGTNTSKIEVLSEIVEVKNQFNQLIEYFTNWGK
ncbi:hypothetical protein EOJ36_06740 [Sandaracinomonas limnophila]|uniref:Uncharacterized protein n=1 Tax=Sandaracinomonas limnophila TaxID=1862386 RepID=A0A437PR21_9BACT|nr:hypothetical protein [Sandaracinomonas limnophila]RVU24705.1 hypothetical protein EOJ36_06740 [Sandaracinomonas limnophila]